MKISQWRDAGRRLEIAGVPVVLFTLYAAWFQWPEATTFYTVTGIILFSASSPFSVSPSPFCGNAFSACCGACD